MGPIELTALELGAAIKKGEVSVVEAVQEIGRASCRERV